MTCSWPISHGDCDECRVKKRCSAHVRGYVSLGKFVERHGYVRRFRSFRMPGEVAHQVCARLVEWVRWPGATRLRLAYDARKTQAEREGCGVIGDIAAAELAALIRADGLDPREQIHPLDGTPVAGLRPAGAEAGRSDCGECGGSGRRAVAPHQYEDCACPLFSRSRTWVGNWPALLEIVHYLDMSGPLLDYAMAYEPGDGWQGIQPMVTRKFTACDDDMLIAADTARSLGHPVDKWLDDSGLWADVHAWRPVIS